MNVKVDILNELATKNKRDTRTHEERFTALLDAFERLRARALASGRINECSIIKVCEKANVKDVYLHTNKVKDQTINNKYHGIKKQINDFRNSFKADAPQSELNLAIKARDTMKAERDKAHIQIQDSIKQIEGFEFKLKVSNDRLQAQNHLAVDIAQNNLQHKTIFKNNFASFSEAKVVSPDTHRNKGGKYSFHDINIGDAAWRTSRHEFEELLKRKLPTRVYILVGAPCSGKTEWTKQSNYYSDLHPVVVDATNPTKSDRSSWFSLIYKYKNQVKIKVCAVFFDTPYVVLMERNNKRPPDKRLTDDVLQGKFNELEPVTVFEGFDEIMVVKHG